MTEINVPGVVEGAFAVGPDRPIRPPDYDEKFRVGPDTGLDASKKLVVADTVRFKVMR